MITRFEAPFERSSRYEIALRTRSVVRSVALVGLLWFATGCNLILGIEPSVVVDPDETTADAGSQLDASDGSGMVGDGGDSGSAVGHDAASLDGSSARDAAGDAARTQQPDGDGPRDETPPDFAGVLRIETVAAASVSLSWDAATDDTTRREDIVYDVFVAHEVDDIDVETDQPWMTSEAGSTAVTVETLASNTAYAIVVVARDEAGNRSAPSQPANVTTLVSFQVDVQGIFASKQCTACHGGPHAIVMNLAPAWAYGSLVYADATTTLGAGYRRVLPGNPDESHLIHRLEGSGPLAALDGVSLAAARQPPDGNYLSPEEIAVIRLWITQGADYN